MFGWNEVEKYRAIDGGELTDAHLYYINTDAEACKSCHEYIINPLGIGMEDFDAVGLLRTEYANGQQVDFTGYQPEKENHNAMLYGIDDLFDNNEKQAFTGTKELARFISTQDVSRSCFNDMAFRYVMGTGHDEFNYDNPDTIAMAENEREQYSCVTDAMNQAMSANNNSAKAALIEIGLSDLVRFRKERNRSGEE